MSKPASILTIWTPRIRNAWQLPNELTVSQWADKYRKLNAMIASEPGQWHTDRTPYLRGIMDAFTNPLVEKITVMSSTQVGKTEGMYNMLGYAIDQDPAPVLMVEPREADAKVASKNRIRPMIEDSEQLRRHFTPDPDDLTRMEFKLDRMIIYFAGSNSPAGLSGKAIRYLFLNETDKYPKFSGEEADPIKLATERTSNYWNRKIVANSTPTTKNGYIYREYERSDKRNYYVPCPHCGGYQVLDFEQIKVPKDERDPERIRIERIAWYECIYCKKKITDLMKQKMLLDGLWLPQSIKIDSKGRLPEKIDIPQVSHVGFHLNALYSPWKTFSAIIAEFFDSKDRPELLMNFVNSWLAQIWQEKIEETKPERLLRLCADYNRGMVPEGAILLTAGVDVQKGYFVIVIRAFGVYPESWLILEEITDKQETLEKILFQDRYPSLVPDIEPFEICLSCIDTGYETSIMYDLCRKYKGLARAIKGKDQLTGVPYKVTNIDKYPNTGKHIPGGLLLYLLDTTYFKDKISRMVHAEEQICKWHLHKTPSPDYLKQFCGEHKILKLDKKGGKAYEIWQPVSPHAKTNFWDAEVYVMAAAEMARVYTLREEDIPKPVLIQPQEEQEPKIGKWLSKRNNWIRRKT